MKDYTREHLRDLDDTIVEVRRKISQDPDPFLVEVLIKLETIRRNRQNNLENVALRDKVRGGFKGIGVC